MFSSFFSCCFHVRANFCIKQKTAYGMRISGWSSDVCSSDLLGRRNRSLTCGDAVLLSAPGEPASPVTDAAGVRGERQGLSGLAQRDQRVALASAPDELGDVALGHLRPQAARRVTDDSVEVPQAQRARAGGTSGGEGQAGSVG